MLRETASACLVASVVSCAPPQESAKPLPSFVQSSVPSGSTNIAPGAGVDYELERAPTPQVSALVAAFAAASSFRDRGGALVSSATASAITNTSTPIVRVTPATPLAADSWYQFRPGLADAGEYAVKTPLSPTADINVWFFTGSAPALRHLARNPTAKGDAAYISVYLTEAVSLEALATGFTLYSGATRLDGCVYRENACVTGPSQVHISAFDFRLEGPSASQRPTRVVFRGDIAGATRTFAEAQSLMSGRDGGPDDVTYDAPASEWTQCQSGTAECWRPDPP